MNSDRVQLLVLAKEPIPGRVKTRLCPPCTPADAATIARAALNQTLSVVAATPARNRVLVLDGKSPRTFPNIATIPQRGDGLDERLANAFEDAGAPSLLIGMDTPQVTKRLLRRAMAALMTPGTDAVLGPTLDGGYWAIGLREANPDAFIGVPMSTAQTAARQMDRLRALGLRCVTLTSLTDVDRFEDAVDVADSTVGTEFAAVVGEVARIRMNA